MADLVFTRTSRGFAVARFQDLYGSQCSLQKSSLADLDAVWLGVDQGADGIVACRMHLSQEMIRDMLPALQHFVDHGELPCDSDGTEAVRV